MHGRIRFVFIYRNVSSWLAKKTKEFRKPPLSPAGWFKNPNFISALRNLNVYSDVQLQKGRPGAGQNHFQREQRNT